MIDALIWMFGSLACFVLGTVTGIMLRDWHCFRKGFKKGYHMGCMTAKKVVHLFENEKGDPGANFFDGDKAISSVANVPPSKFWNE